jgi:integral membrane protein
MSRPFTLRVIALAEATTFLALLVATYIKHSDNGEGGVQVLGPVHGALFLAYVWSAVVVGQRLGWPAKTTVLVLLGAVLPFGGYVVDLWLRRQSQPQPSAG